MKNSETITGVLVDETVELSLSELSRVCQVRSEWIVSLVDEAILEPTGTNTSNWRFLGTCVRRVRSIQRLETDLGVNLAGAAVIVELLDEVKLLRSLVGPE